MQKTAAMKRAGAVMGVTIAVLCVLLVAFSYYHATRATISPYGELSLWDTIVMNSDIIMGLVFLAACSVPFFLKFERRKPRAREMVPLAVMAALGVVGRTVFQLIPLPNFKPVSALWRGGCKNRASLGAKSRGGTLLRLCGTPYAPRTHRVGICCTMRAA